MLNERKLDTTGHLLCDCVCMKCPERQIYRHRAGAGGVQMATGRSVSIWEDEKVLELD